MSLYEAKKSIAEGRARAAHAGQQVWVTSKSEAEFAVEVGASMGLKLRAVQNGDGINGSIKYGWLVKKGGRK